jgi:hypothetical protein
MNVHNLLKIAETVLRKNSPAILTAIGVTGTLTTAYLAARASFKAAEIIRVEEENKPPHFDAQTRFKERTKLVWKLYIPAAVTSVATIGCLISATKIGNRKLAASIAAYSLSEKAFVEYKEKVIDQIGARKEQAVRDEIAQDRVNANPPSREIVLGSGHVLCHEAHTGRYFESDMESLRKAMNDVNAKVLSEMWVTLSDFYYLIGLPRTSESSEFGWKDGKQLALMFTTLLTPDNRPCLSFEYNYLTKL